MVDAPHEMEQSVVVPLNEVPRAVPGRTVRVEDKRVTTILRVKVARDDLRAARRSFPATGFLAVPGRLKIRPRSPSKT